jgi:tRNA(fMet)-specific endonuclease VapC
MSPRYILDTDHVSLYQRRHPQVVACVLATAPADLAVTTITLGEQVQGRLAVIRQARSQPDVARGHLRLRETVEFYQVIQLVDYSTPTSSTGLCYGTTTPRSASACTS